MKIDKIIKHGMNFSVDITEAEDFAIESFQTELFTFGYKWRSGGDNVKPVLKLTTDHKNYYRDPNIKYIVFQNKLMDYADLPIYDNLIYKMDKIEF
jgi:hypothetical protein